MSGTWILRRKFRPISELLFFELFYFIFIAFKLTFILLKLTHSFIFSILSSDIKRRKRIAD
jgi:hypothetical protein